MKHLILNSELITDILSRVVVLALVTSPIWVSYLVQVVTSLILNS
jgi:hypothetical protein